MIDPTKPVKTRSGLEVRLFPDLKGTDQYPMLGAIKRKSGWIPVCWTAEGGSYEGAESDFDLVQSTPRVQRMIYLNIYRSHLTVWNSKEDAAYAACSDCLATVEVNIDVEEGHAP